MSPMLLAQNAVPPLTLRVPTELGTPLLVILGLVLLLFGRKLYWAFIAIAGFLLGMALGAEWLADKEQWVRILAAVLAGLAGAVLAIVVQRLAFAIGGFFAGGYLAMSLAARLSNGGDPHSQIWMIVGGIIGAIVAAMVLDWAIIVLSSLAGAVAILSPFAPKMSDQVLTLVFLLITVIGIVIQSGQLAGRAAPPPPVAPPPAA